MGDNEEIADTEDDMDIIKSCDSEAAMSPKTLQQMEREELTPNPLFILERGRLVVTTRWYVNPDGVLTREREANYLPSKSHTPGPWEVLDGGEHLTISPTWGGFTICRMHELYNDETIAANARLIAAAPQMLEALERVRDTLTTLDALDCVDAAIAAARGDDD